MTFRVIDKKTGKEADPYEIALHEEWAKELCYCDMDGFAILEDGTLLLVDECGKFEYCDADRFEVVFDDERPHGEWRTTPNPNHSPFDSTSEVIYMCSQCAYSSGERIVETWHFCPNCGAPMTEEALRKYNGLKEGEKDGQV